MSTITTKAFGTQHAKGNLGPITIERRAPLEDDVAIKILYCGVCHTDLHMVNEDWKRNEYPLVPGHEIVGEVISVGSKVSKFKAGDKVGVGFSVDSCRTCETCKKSLVQYCVDNIQTAAYVDKYHDGRQTYGGYSEMIVVRQEYVVTIPNGFADLAAVAPLLCAGITMYSPLAWYKVTQGTKVGIVGYGGLGHMGVKFARAMGAEVTVFSRSDQGTLTKLGTHIAHAIGAHVEMTTDKEAEAKQAGASRVIVSDDPAQMAEYADYFDLILDTIPYQHDLTPYIKCVGIGGVFCGVGYMGPTTKIDTSLLIFGRKTIAGSAIGSTKEMEEMMEFSLKHGVLANVEKINIREVNDVYKRMLKSEVDHRYVIDMSTI